jgi:hypothetical protein
MAERPDIGKTPIGPGKAARLVATTRDISEADRIAEHYQAQGFETQIIKKSQGGLAIYEVWASKEPEIFMGKGR